MKCILQDKLAGSVKEFASLSINSELRFCDGRSGEERRGKERRKKMKTKDENKVESAVNGTR